MADQGVTAKTAGKFNNDLAYGGIDYISDVDWFEVSAEGDTLYKVILEGYGTSDPLSDGTLRLLDKKGKEITDELPLTVEENPSTGLYSLTFINGAKASDYFVAVAGDANLVGNYRLTLDTISDDYGDTAKTAGELAAAEQAGHIDWAGDVDWFALDVETDTHYTITLNST
ncbi:hypothetical protein, partial [Imhoffiella purpurea]|uniref:hypothetical protein n=1 Tax=Imhoffiella purpurea TaxID=1249627 RepID=UPI0005C2477C